MLFTKILEERRSKYNGDVKVIKSLGYGMYIQCNGLTQSGGIVENIWKNTLKKININCKNILILGLGGGTVTKLLRKKYPDAKITGVEIDPLMIELGKKYFDLDKQNIDIKIMDAHDYSLSTSRYDLIIVDGYIGDKYVDFLSKDLKKSKLVVFNKLFFKDKKKEALEFGKKLTKMFKKVDYFYPPANLMFICYN
jgi:spermidine synthase